ncbi:hypothetical protein AAE026_05775 [Bradyrhizobium sp. DN5]|uniref:hypothetical protein n=1 Tax=Bradyrhizobium sp. DN5 TaxID=3056950 RepID=UPI003525C773
MQSTTRILLAFAVFSVAPVVTASALFAGDDYLPSSSTMVGMMSRGNMSGLMERMHMMGHCGAMMRSDGASGRPNDQWRAPRSPDADGRK